MFENIFKRKQRAQKQSTRPSELAGKMIAKLKFPHRVFSAGTDYMLIMKAYEESEAEGKKRGFIPVLVPVDPVLEAYLEMMEEDDYSVEENIKNASSETGKRFLEQRYQEYLVDYEEDFDSGEEELIGTYDDEPEKLDHCTAIFELGSQRTVETIMFEVPTSNPWELVAYIPFGGWNECPEADMMVSVCKYWFEKYGAVPVTISHDVLEMSVPECVSETDSLNLAKEHYAFTPDRVDQCTRTSTISEVAASLYVSKIWYFWWD